MEATLKKHDLEGIDDILQSMQKTTKLGKQLDHAKIWERWPDLVGNPYYHHCRPLDVRDGCLRIEVDSSVWMHRLGFRRWEIIKAVNRMAKKKLLSDVFLILMNEDGDEDPGKGKKKPSKKQ